MLQAIVLCYARAQRPDEHHTECFFKYESAHCTSDSTYGAHYVVVTNEAPDVQVPTVRMVGEREIRDERTNEVIAMHKLLTVEFTARYWTTCPDATSSWEAHSVPREWQWEANNPHWQATDEFQRRRVVAARREPPRCKHPIRPDDPEGYPVEKEELVTIAGVDVYEPYFVDRLALPPSRLQRGVAALKKLYS